MSSCKTKMMNALWTRVSLGVCLALALLAGGGCDWRTEIGPVANASSVRTMREALAGGQEAAAEAEAKPQGTGWATLKGRFTYDGDPPTMPPYNVNKDMATCAPGGQAPKQDWLVVGSDGGLANVAIFLRKASRVHESAEPPSEPAVFDQEDCVFLSHVFPIVVGQPMLIKNSDPVGHNTSISGNNTFNQIIAANESTQIDIQREEALPVSVTCSIHPWMKAYLLSRDNAYVAVTKPDGTFEIPNLPAGEELEFQVWHESAAGSNQALVVDTPETQELDWSKKGRFTITLEENETRELNVAAPSSAFTGG